LQQWIVAISVPHMREGDRRTVLRRLDRLLAMPVVRVIPEMLEHNPEKARAWFENMGATVQ